MNITYEITNSVKQFPKGDVFTYMDFEISVDKSNAVIQVLNRMVREGFLKKLSKGRYYRPKATEFGELQPDVFQTVKDLLRKDGKAIGYLSGYSIFNAFLLTTQVSNTIQIGYNTEKKSLTRGVYKIRFIKQTNQITRDNIQVLQILDCIRFIKIIPDTNQNNSCKRIIQIIEELSENKLNLLIKLVLKYNASTRALTGAMLDTLFGDKNKTLALFQSLNPATTYSLSISEQVLPTKDKWRIN